MTQGFLKINLGDIEQGLYLEIIPETNASARQISSYDAEEYGECIDQIFEGQSYEFEIVGSDRYTLSAPIKGIVLPSKKNGSRGRLCPNIYVGKLVLFMVDKESDAVLSKIYLEVVATKFDRSIDKSYRNNYRQMLEDITEKCSELLMQVNTPVYQNFDVNYDNDANTVYQRFSFIKSFIDSEDFASAISKIISNPSTTWEQEDVMIHTNQVKRVTGKFIRQLTSHGQRTSVPESHYLYQQGLKSIPEKIESTRKVESLDTSENRFIKHALETFRQFIESCQDIFLKKNMDHPANEAKHFVDLLNRHLGHSFFDQIGIPNSIKLNSPVLQKRSGYREILNRWLQFDLASKLIWKGGDDVYAAGKKDIATLYEYWLFFVLLDTIKEKFGYVHQIDVINPYGELIEVTSDGLNVKLKSGKYSVIEGASSKYHRDISYKFTYNRAFYGNTTYDNQKAGSWTTTLRPDYTLSFWPTVFTEAEAEQEDAIVHIHFDAKYKIQDFAKEIIDSGGNPDLVDQEEKKGVFKNVDLLKMHAYKDAIHRTAGAYILYPGKTPKQFKGFHEIIPGLGAFSINPSVADSGLAELSSFIDRVITNLLDRTSQRERITNKNYQILRDSYSPTEYRLPEFFDRQKIDLGETFVIIGYVKSKEHLSWCIDNGLYNFRMNDDKGTLVLTSDVVNAKYLLIREKNSSSADKLFEITGLGPKVYSKEKLMKLGYVKPSKNEYLIIEIEPIKGTELTSLEFSFKELKMYKDIQMGANSGYEKAGKPFVVSLTELLNVSIAKKNRTLEF